MDKFEQHIKRMKGLRDMYQALQLQQGGVIKSVCECGSTKFNTTIEDKPFCFLCGKDARQTVL